MKKSGMKVGHKMIEKWRNRDTIFGNKRGPKGAWKMTPSKEAQIIKYRGNQKTESTRNLKRKLNFNVSHMAISRIFAKYGLKYLLRPKTFSISRKQSVNAL